MIDVSCDDTIVPIPPMGYVKEHSNDSIAQDESPQFTQGFGNQENHTRTTHSSSLVFGRGGSFLSKYQVEKEYQMGTTRQRKGANEARSSNYLARPDVAPDRMHVELNSMMVNARHHEKVMQIVDANIESFNIVNLITACHRLGTLVVPARRGSLRRDMRFKRLIHGLSDILRNTDACDLKPRDLSNAAWALTKLGLLGVVHVEMSRDLSFQIKRTISDFEPVNLSTSLWAFARSGFPDESLFRVAAVEVKRQLPDFQPQQISNTIWAMAKSGFVDKELFLAAAELALQQLSNFRPMNFSMLLYSFALAKLPHPKLFEKVGQRCTVEELSSDVSSPHVVTNLALAFSSVGGRHSDVFHSIAQVAISSLQDFRPQQLTTLIQAFAKAGARHEKLLAKVSSNVVLRLSEFRHQELQELFEAFRILGAPTVDIARAIAAEPSDSEPKRSARLYFFLLLVVFALCVAFVDWTYDNQR